MTKEDKLFFANCLLFLAITVQGFFIELGSHTCSTRFYKTPSNTWSTSYTTVSKSVLTRIKVSSITLRISIGNGWEPAERAATNRIIKTVKNFIFVGFKTLKRFFLMRVNMTECYISKQLLLSILKVSGILGIFKPTRRHRCVSDEFLMRSFVDFFLANRFANGNRT